MKQLYKPLGFLFSVLGGLLANAAFERVWARISGDRTAPQPTSPSHSTREVLLAAALQGAIFGIVKAAIDRAGAKGYQRLTGTDPGEGR